MFYDIIKIFVNKIVIVQSQVYVFTVYRIFFDIWELFDLIRRGLGKCYLFR